MDHVTLRSRPLTLEVTTLVGDTGLHAPSVYLSVYGKARRPSRSEDIEHLLVSISWSGDLDL